MKKYIVLILLITSCSASKIMTTPPVAKPYKFARLAPVDNDGKAKALEILKIK